VYLVQNRTKGSTDIKTPAPPELWFIVKKTVGGSADGRKDKIISTTKANWDNEPQQKDKKPKKRPNINSGTKKGTKEGSELESRYRRDEEQ